MKTDSHWIVWKFFRDEFRQLYGSVSVVELATNRNLTDQIQRIENALMEVMNCERSN